METGGWLMKTFKITTLIVFAVVQSGCASLGWAMGSKPPADRIPMEPLVANRYEGLVALECGGKPQWGFGGSQACQFEAGSKTEISVKVPPTEGQVVLRSVRHEEVLDFKKNGWVRVPWEFLSRKDSVPIVITVAGKNSGIQVAKVYPYVTSGERNYPYMSGKVRYWCYEEDGYQEKVGQGWCQQPSGGRLDGSLVLSHAEAGEYLVSVKGCVLEAPAQAKGAFPAGTKEIAFQVAKELPGFCAVALAVKYSTGNIEEAELYLDWWDPRYVPLSKPLLESDDDEVKVCGPLSYKFYEVNGLQKKDGCLSKSCARQPWLDGTWGYGLAWDEAGRMSYETLERGK